MTTQKEMPALLAARTPFEGNSVTAKKNECGTYSVYSYDTLIARWDANGDLVEFNETRYSSTTSKLQNLIRQLES